MAPGCWEGRGVCRGQVESRQGGKEEDTVTAEDETEAHV